MQTAVKKIIALDVGAKRIGVAVADLRTRLPMPLKTLEHNDSVFTDLQNIINEHEVGNIVVGLPRGLSGQITEQTKSTEAFINVLRNRFDIPVDVQDEAVTSKQAEAELQNRGKAYQKGDIDALAATFILEDWLRDHREAVHG